MKRSRFTEEQVVAILREQEAGVATADLCRKHGISTATFYAWKAKFGGMDVSEAKRLKSLEDENAKLKRLLADAMLDNVALKDLLQKKILTPAAKREAVVHLEGTYEDERASGVSGYPGGSQDDPVQSPAALRRPSTSSPARTGCRAAAVRLSASARAPAR